MKNSFAHIKNSVEAFLLENINDFKSKHFLLAVSGGADSVLLSHIFESLKLTYSIAHVNYNLRGSESVGDEKFVNALAKNLKVKIYVNTIKTNELKKTGESIQMLARNIRYDYFNELLSKHRIDYLVLAHHANDQIETVLLNIFRGCGIDGLKGMKSVNNNFLRPLISITRTEIEKAISEKKIKFRTDSSNLKNAYKRNYLRNIVIPTIEKKWPGIEQTMLNNISNFKDALDIVIEKEASFNFDFSKPFEFSLSKLMENPVQLQVLKKSCVKNGFSNSSLAKILLVRKTNESKIISAKIGTLESKNGKIIFTLLSNKLIDEPKLTRKKNNLTITNINSSFFKNKTETISLKKIKGSIHLRKWVAGDKMVPLGMNGFKKISDLLTDLKLTAGQKKEVYLLCDDEKPLWLVGFRLDNRVKLNGKELADEILKIQVV